MNEQEAKKPVGTGQRSLSLDDCEPNLSTAVGVEYEGVVKDYYQDYETPYPMTIKEGNETKTIGYDYKLLFENGQKLPVKSWKFHGQLKDTFHKAGKIAGLKLRVKHVKKGDKDNSGWEIAVLN